MKMDAIALERRGDVDLEWLLGTIRDQHLREGARIVLLPSGLVLDARRKK